MLVVSEVVCLHRRHCPKHWGTSSSTLPPHSSPPPGHGQEQGTLVGAGGLGAARWTGSMVPSP